MTAIVAPATENGKEPVVRTVARPRAVLELARPDAVAVESHPDWFAVGRYEQALGTGRHEGLFGDHPLSGEARRHLADDGSMAFGVVNDVDGDAYGREFARGDQEHPEFGGRRNRGIASNASRPCASIRASVSSWSWESGTRRYWTSCSDGTKACTSCVWAKTCRYRPKSRSRCSGPRATSSSRWATTWTASGCTSTRSSSTCHAWTTCSRCWRSAGGIRASRGTSPAGSRRRAATARRPSPRSRSSSGGRTRTKWIVRSCIRSRSTTGAWSTTCGRRACSSGLDCCSPCIARTKPRRRPRSWSRPSARRRTSPFPTTGGGRGCWPGSSRGPCRSGGGTPAPSPDAGGLRDPGFESGLARSPSEGWYGSGDHLRFEAEEAQINEGERSLCMTVLPAGVGLPCFVSQVVAVPGGSDCRFRLALRGGGIEAARLVAYVWDEDNAAREIAEADVTLPAGQWRQAELTFAVPADERQVGLWVYAVPSKPGRLWLDAAALSAVDRK